MTILMGSNSDLWQNVVESLPVTPIPILTTNPLGRLDLYSTYIVFTTFKGDGEPTRYILDPLQAAAILNSIDLSSGLLPLDCLFWSKRGQERLGVYIPPRLWSITVVNEPRPWQVPLPGFIFVGQGQVYRLWAVAEDPVGPYTRLYKAPCPHISSEGICLCPNGIPFPPAGGAAIWQAADIFFGSRFGRRLSGEKSRIYPDNVLDQWRALAHHAATSYPLEDLVETSLNLERIIDAS